MSLDTYKHEREALFEDSFKKAFGRIEDYRFKGFNHALGCNIESKAHYKRLLKSKGLFPADACEEIAEGFRSNAERSNNKEMSQESQDVIKAIRGCRRRKDGTVELPPRLIEAMVKIKAIGNDSPYDPIHTDGGGWS